MPDDQQPKNRLPFALAKNVRWLYEEHFESNFSKMEAATGVDRKIIGRLVRGDKQNVSSATLHKFLAYGVNLNWLIADVNHPFTVATSGPSLSEKELLDNESSDIKKHVQTAKALLQESPNLRLDADVQSELLEVLRICVGGKR